MDANHGHGYIQEDHGSYDDLMQNQNWTNPSGQFLFNQQPDDLYARYSTQQPNFDHYNVSQQQQPAYPSLPYSNSPYGAQFQHARPSDVFGPTGNIDPTLQTPNHFQPADRSFSVAPNATISPQYLQYGVASAQPANRAVSADFNRAANTMSPDNFNQRQDHASLYFNPAQNANVQRSSSNPIQYPALPQDSQTDSRQALKQEVDPPPNITRPQPSKAVQPSNPLRMTHPELYAKRNSSSRPQMPHAPFVYFEDQPVQVALGLKNTLPKYHPRKSRSGRELVPGFDISKSFTPARISIKKEKAPKEPKVVSKWKGTSQGPKSANKLSNLREEGDFRSPNKTPSTPTESSSSDEESSSEEESEYEEDTIPVIDIKEVRGAERPTDIAMATRYDAIGIIWKDPNSNPSSEVIKTAIETYGNFVIALRTQIKNNLSEATAHPADASKLKQARLVLLEQLYQAIRAANEHGYGPIVENLGGHQRLVNNLTTTLIECTRAEDYLGKLPRAVFTLLARFQTMTDDLLKRLKFDSIQKRWGKKGDEQINKDIATILANTTDAKERVAKAKKDAPKTEEPKKIPEKIEPAKQRITDSKKVSSTTSAKRPHDGDGANGKPAKKLASDSAVAPASKIGPIPKRTNLLGIASKPVAKPVAKKREASPPTESKLGALLASIAEPPKPPKAPEAPPRAPETPEEKSRRERKESRRHLRVKFKEGPDLEEIRLFKHEQAEDEGRQDDMLRDAHDDRSEGMMLKRRISETIDEDEDAQSDWEDKPYPELVSIDFSGLDKHTIFGPKFITRGGDLTFTTPEQEAQARRELLELMAIYTDANDIPTSPKEPPVPPVPQIDGTEDTHIEQRIKTPNVPWLSQRLQEIEQHGPHQAHQNFMRRMEAEHRARGTSTSSSTNINSILQQLGGPGQSTSQQPASTHGSGSVALMDAQALANIEQIIKSLKGKPYPATEPPGWMRNEGQRAEWWNGYTRDKAINDHRQSEQQMDLDQYQPPPPALLPTQPVQQMPVQPYQPPPPPSMASAAPIAEISQQMQAALASYAHGNSSASAQQYDYNAWVAAAAAAQTQTQGYPPQPQPPRWDDGWNENTPPQGSKSRENGSSKAKQRGFELREFPDPPKNTNLFDENGEYKGKKKPCRFYKEGKCAKGAKCTYLHD